MEFKTLIITFSQTGYTRKTAEQIRDGIHPVTGHCDLADLADVEAGKKKDTEHD